MSTNNLIHVVLVTALLLGFASSNMMEKAREYKLNEACIVNDQSVEDWLTTYNLQWNNRKQLNYAGKNFYTFSTYLFPDRYVNPPAKFPQKPMSYQHPQTDFYLVSETKISKQEELEDWLFNNPDDDRRDNKPGGISDIYSKNGSIKCKVVDNGDDTITIYAIYIYWRSSTIWENYINLKYFRHNLMYRISTMIDLLVAFDHVHKQGGTVKYSSMNDIKFMKYDGDLGFLPELTRFDNLSRDTSVEAKTENYLRLAVAMVFLLNENLRNEAKKDGIDGFEMPSIFEECHASSYFGRFDPYYCTYFKPYVNTLLYNKNGDLDLLQLANQLKLTMLQLNKLLDPEYQLIKTRYQKAQAKKNAFDNAKHSIGWDAAFINNQHDTAWSAKLAYPEPYFDFADKERGFEGEIKQYYSNNREATRKFLDYVNGVKTNNERII